MSNITAVEKALKSKGYEPVVIDGQVELYERKLPNGP